MHTLTTSKASKLAVFIHYLCTEFRDALLEELAAEIHKWAEAVAEEKVSTFDNNPFLEIHKF